MIPDNERASQIHSAIDLLIRTTRLHHRNIERLFGDTGLHRSQRRLLMLLSRCEEAPSQREIADKFDISPACVARTLKSLASDGYISRTGAENDLRRNNVSITEKGLSTIDETRRAFDRIDQRAFEGLSSDEINQLIRLLDCVQENLRALEETPIPTIMKGSASN